MLHRWTRISSWRVSDVCHNECRPHQAFSHACQLCWLFSVTIRIQWHVNIHSGSVIGSFGFRGRDFVFVLGTARGVRGRRSPGGTWPPGFALAKLGGRGVCQRASARPPRVRAKLISPYRSQYEYKINQNKSKNIK